MATSKITPRIIKDSDKTAVNSYVSCRMASGIVFVWGQSSGQLTLAADTWNSVGTLPEAFRPSENVYFIADNTARAAAMRGYIGTDGSINLYPDSSATSYWLVYMSFIK